MAAEAGAAPGDAGPEGTSGPAAPGADEQDGDGPRAPGRGRTEESPGRTEVQRVEPATTASGTTHPHGAERDAVVRDTAVQSTHGRDAAVQDTHGPDTAVQNTHGRETATPRADVDERPLIGTTDLVTPRWAEGAEAAVGAGLGATTSTAWRTTRQVVRWAWAGAPRLTALLAVVQVLAGAVSAFGLLATANVFTQLLEQGPTPERVVAALPALAVVAASFAARGLLDAAVEALTASLVPRVRERVQNELNDAVLGLDLVAFDDPDFTALVEQVSDSAPMSAQHCTRAAGDLVAALVSMVAAVATAGVLHPLLAPVVLLAALPNGWASIRSARMMLASFLRTFSARRRSSVVTNLTATRANAAEVRAFTTRPVLKREHDRLSAALADEAVAVGLRQSTIHLVGRTLAGVGSGLAYVVLGVLIVTGSLALALAGAAALAMQTASRSVSVVVYQANSLFESGYYLDLMAVCVAGARERGRAPARAELAGDPEEIRLDGVSFTYPNADEPAVDGVSVTLRRGEVVALVGENGSGKTTLAKLLVGLYVAAAGRVTWDGVDLAEVDPDEALSRVAVVLQDPVHWPMSADNNVRIGRLTRPDPDDAARDGAARDSGADVVVSELPGGWDTVLSTMFQDGRDLSGGQWQRLSVARGLFRDAPVVVADEPTAALDARAEHAVFATLHGRGLRERDRITVLVTHRLANVRFADQILVLEHGRLTEHGQHDELMALGGTYAELFTLQAKAYADVPTEGGPADTVAV